MSVEAPNSDADLLDLIRIAGPLSVTELADAMEVTATAVRQRLTRLMSQSMIEREAIRAGAAVPSTVTRLPTKGCVKQVPTLPTWLWPFGGKFGLLAMRTWAAMSCGGFHGPWPRAMPRSPGHHPCREAQVALGTAQPAADSHDCGNDKRQPVHPHGPCLPLSESGRRGPEYL